MLKNYTCIVCPNGCDITVEFENRIIHSIKGASCKCGDKYVEQELTNPHRTIASSIRLDGGELPLVSVRLSNPIPKEKIFNVMEVIKKAHLTAPVSIGQIAIANVLGLGSDVIVTKDIMAK
jgi:CxxC motif-containing protein